MNEAVRRKKRRRRFEPEMVDYLLSKFNPDTVFLDVGANIGYYTLMAAPLVRHVAAFEPQPPFQEKLKRRIAEAGYTNVAVYSDALFSKSIRGAMDSRGIFHPNRLGGPKVMATTLDSLGLDPMLVKIDVEGAEMDVLLGGKETLLTHRPDLAIEVHHRRIEKYFGFKRTEVSKFLESLGYAVSLLKPDGGHIRAEWKS